MISQKEVAMLTVLSAMTGIGKRKRKTSDDWIMQEEMEVPEKLKNQPKKLSAKQKAKMKAKASEPAKETPKIIMGADFARPHGADEGVALVYCGGVCIGRMKSVDLPTVIIKRP